MFPPDHIKDFVQHTLGCSSPEEVFRSIDMRNNVHLGSFITLDSAIIIGNRLLVYIAVTGSAGCIEEHLPVLYAAGMKERNEKRLNRFRLVLVVDGPEKDRRIAERQFEELRGGDEKVHLHMLTSSPARRPEIPAAPSHDGTLLVPASDSIAAPFNPQTYGVRPTLDSTARAAFSSAFAVWPNFWQRTAPGMDGSRERGIRSL